ncbi:hypothetical protein M1N47_00405 [Dehalococcoidia bacterium]|nr:hypothetical protein [Dehalococcoidia bacterium]
MKTKRTKLTKQMYLDALARDDETLALIRRNRPEGEGMLDTPEKRACFRVGFDAGPGAQTGRFGHPDTEKERFHGWRALHPKKATPNDAFYAQLGANLAEAWE